MQTIGPLEYTQQFSLTSGGIMPLHLELGIDPSHLQRLWTCEAG